MNIFNIQLFLFMPKFQLYKGYLLSALVKSYILLDLDETIWVYI